jgi:hypothetical protein
MRRVEHDQVIRALASDRADQAFNISVLPGRTERRGSVPDPHCSDTSLERDAIGSVIVANEIFRRAVPRERFGDLARQPLSRRIAGHREPRQSPSFVPENQKCEQRLKRNRRDHKQINRCNPVHMVEDKGLPALRWPIWPRHHVDRNRGLGDLDAELEQFAVDLGGAPERDLKAHSSDQVAQLFGDPRSASGRTRLPSPISGETHSMPAYDGLGPDDGYGVKDARAATVEPNEQGTIGPTQMQSGRRSLLQNIELMPQYEDLGFQLVPRSEEVEQRAEEQEADCNHAAIMF